MGFSISWLAVRGKSPEAVAHHLGLTPTGEITDYGESLFTGRTLPRGWFLLVIDEYEHSFVKPSSLAALSISCDVLACSIEEHVMFCSSEMWRNAAQIWRIEHDAQKSLDHISHSGSLPDGYSAIEAEFAVKQKEAGARKECTDYYFEIPLQTAKSIVGFKHDEVSPGDDDFQVFSETIGSSAVNRNSEQAGKPWWKLW